MKSVVVSFLLFLTSIAFSQTEPLLFEPEVISKDGVFGLTLSPDSKTALWVRSNGKRDTLQIMESRKMAGKWSTPKVASFSSASGNWKDIDPIFSPDGKTVLFQSNRNTHRDTNRKDFDIWMVPVTKEGWGAAYPLDTLVNTTTSESYASITNKGTIYFMKENENKVGQSDIYYSVKKNGKYQKPINIGAPINTNERESNPYISPKGDYIVYFSSTSEGYGEVDLYISFYKNKTWTKPKNLGLPINSAVAEFCPFVQEKEKRLYFTRQEKVGERFKENIFYVPFDVDAYK